MTKMFAQQNTRFTATARETASACNSTSFSALFVKDAAFAASFFVSVLVRIIGIIGIIELRLIEQTMPNAMAC